MRKNNGKHYEIKETVGGIGVLSIIVNKPIVTVELSLDDKYPQMWGMAYCRPCDTWNPRKGIALAMQNMFDKFDVSKIVQVLFWEKIVPYLNSIRKPKQKYDNSHDTPLAKRLHAFLAAENSL